MRGRFAFVIILGVAGVAVANAADTSREAGANGNEYYSESGGRIEPLIVYDFEPGVIVRSYWYAPWGNRHYFPSTGRRPKVGRREHIPARRVSKAEDYFRFWSVSSAFGPELPPARMQVAPPLLPPTPMQVAPPLLPPTPMQVAPPLLPPTE